MNSDGLKKMLEQVRTGDMPVDRALETLKDLPYADLGYAMVDHHRALRSGHPETIFSRARRLPRLSASPAGCWKKTLISWLPGLTGRFMRR